MLMLMSMLMSDANKKHDQRLKTKNNKTEKVKSIEGNEPR